MSEEKTGGEPDEAGATGETAGAAPLTPKPPQLRGFDLRNLAGHAELIGVDEAGRGALAGPVVAAAVLVRRVFLESRWVAHNASRVNDSKQLSAPERDALAFEFETLAVENAIRVGCGVAEVSEIEQFNILGATKLAMRRALECIHPPRPSSSKWSPTSFRRRLNSPPGATASPAASSSTASR